MDFLWLSIIMSKMCFTSLLSCFLSEMLAEKPRETRCGFRSSANFSISGGSWRGGDVFAPRHLTTLGNAARTCDWENSGKDYYDHGTSCETQREFNVNIGGLWVLRPLVPSLQCSRTGARSWSCRRAIHPKSSEIRHNRTVKEKVTWYQWGPNIFFQKTLMISHDLRILKTCWLFNANFWKQTTDRNTTTSCHGYGYFKSFSLQDQVFVIEMVLGRIHFVLQDLRELSRVVRFQPCVNILTYLSKFGNLHQGSGVKIPKKSWNPFDSQLDLPIGILSVTLRPEVTHVTRQHIHPW